MNPVITFIIPVYNGEKTIQKALDSILLSETEEFEVIVVNDGSTDCTKGIIEAYMQRYPEIVRLIDKPNGGHGSGINAAIPNVCGKYFKVLDADDWISTDSFGAYVSNLKTCTADVVLTNFRTININDGHIIEFKINCGVEEITYDFESFWANHCDTNVACCFHTITYQTQFYREHNFKLLERVSYEDHQYATIPFAYVNTICLLNMFIYEYSIGSANQSVSDENQVKRIKDLESVFWAIESACPNAGVALKYFNFKMSESLLSIYTTALIKNHDKQNGRLFAKSFRTKLKGKNKFLYKASTKQYYSLLALSFMKLDGSKLSKLKKTVLYKTLHHAIRRG